MLKDLNSLCFWTADKTNQSQSTTLRKKDSTTTYTLSVKNHIF